MIDFFHTAESSRVHLGQWNILSQLLNQKYETSLNMRIVIDMNKPNSLLTERDAGRVKSAHASFYRDETKRNEITFLANASTCLLLPRLRRKTFQ